MIYVRANKVIYGTVKAALKAYKKLAKYLRSWGLEMNPYNPCVWNKVVDDNQMTLIFHIDDILLSHRKSHVVTEYIKLLDGAYGQVDSLTVTRGKHHEYLGMSLDFGFVEGACIITQYDFIKKMFKNLPKELRGPHKKTPAPSDLFKVDKESPLVADELVNSYHEHSAKSLWLRQRERPDM